MIGVGISIWQGIVGGSIGAALGIDDDPLAPGPLQGFLWTTGQTDNTPNFDITFDTTSDPPQLHAAGMWLYAEVVPGIEYFLHEILAADLLGGATINLAAVAQA